MSLAGDQHAIIHPTIMNARIPRFCLARAGRSLSIASQPVSRVAARRCFSTTPLRSGEHNDDRLRFPGALEAKFTTDLKFENPKDKGVIPCYRVMDSEGVIVDETYKRDFSDEEAIKLYTDMLAVSIMDLICLDAQRQGRQIACPRDLLGLDTTANPLPRSHFFLHGV